MTRSEEQVHEIVGTHKHIRGLGLDKNFRAVRLADGMVGQQKAREAAGVLVRVAKQGELGGRLVILAGPPGSGKTAVAVAIARELGGNTPFVHLSASEIYSAERKKTEVLYDALRTCVTVELSDSHTIYEGVVEKLDIFRIPVGQQDPHRPAPDNVRLTLRNGKESRVIEGGGKVAMQIIELQVRENDTIAVDALSGKISIIGRDGEKSASGDALARASSRAIAVPLTQLDLYAAKVYSEGALARFDGSMSPKELEPRIRSSVDYEVNKWVKAGVAKIKPGVLFLDDAHLLDLECLAALNKAAEGEIAPIIILATNRGVTKISGTEIESPMGLPRDVIDRAVIIPTSDYTLEEIAEILKVRAREEKADMTKDAITELTRVASKTSLRYAIQLQSLAANYARSEGVSKVRGKDVKKVAALFMDVGDVIKHLKRYEDKMLR